VADSAARVAAIDLGASSGRVVVGHGTARGFTLREIHRFANRTRREHENRERNGGGAAAQPDADGGTACLASIARTGAPRGAAPPHSVTIQACPYMYKS